MMSRPWKTKTDPETVPIEGDLAAKHKGRALNNTGYECTATLVTSAALHQLSRDCLNDKISMTTTVGHSLETSGIANTVPRKEEKGTISA